MLNGVKRLDHLPAGTERACIFSAKHLHSVVFNGLNQETASTCIVAPATEDYKAPNMPRIVFGSCFNGQLCCTAGPLCVNIGRLRQHYTRTIKHGQTWSLRSLKRFYRRFEVWICLLLVGIVVLSEATKSIFGQIRVMRWESCQSNKQTPKHTSLIGN